MARCPFAVWRPLTENTTAPRIVPRVLLYHSASVNTSNLFEFFERYDIKVESHFFIRWNGVIEQFIDTERRADANRYANPFAISVETEDDGDPNTQRWTPAQLDAMARLGKWVLAAHPTVAPVRVKRWDGSGIGYHTIFGSPSPYTPVRKTCPGTIRVKQFDQELLPRILNRIEVPVVHPEPDVIEPAMVLGLPVVVDVRYPPEGGVILLGQDGSVWAFGDARYRGGANGQPYFIGRRAAKFEPHGESGYTIVAHTGERYDYP